jgi:hypothetical protein
VKKENIRKNIKNDHQNVKMVKKQLMNRRIYLSLFFNHYILVEMLEEQMTMNNNQQLDRLF